MTVWDRVKLGDMVETQKGYAFKSGWYCDAGRPIVKVSDFTDDAVDSTALVCIPEATANEYLKYELRTGDVVVQTVGSWPSNPASVVGKCVRIPIDVAGALLNQNAVKLKPVGKFHKTFLFYLLRNEDFKTYIIGTAQGAASQAAITLEAIRGYEFELPPLPVQRRIAGILSAYDELIENSQRRIKILESMARALYREWFVHFRFPGHESVPRVPSPLGDIPKGWEIKMFGEIYNTCSGGTPSRKRPEYFESGIIDWVKSQELLDRFILNTEEQITAEAIANSSAKVLPPNTVLVALYGATIGMLAITSRFVATNQACCAVLPKLEGFGREFAFLTLLTNRQRIIGLRLGAAQQNISQVLLRNFECIVPPTTIAAAFADRVSPLFDGILACQQQIQNLRRTRDLLLPRLMSGQVNLEES
jgi:type I restriction enzyme, S subunit